MPQVIVTIFGRFAARFAQYPKWLYQICSMPQVILSDLLNAPSGCQNFRPLRGQIHLVSTFILTVTTTWGPDVSKQRGGSITWGRVNHLGLS